MQRAPFIFGLALVASVAFPAAVQAHANHPIPVKAEYSRPADVTSWTADFKGRVTFPTFDKKYRKGGFLAAGDIDGNGIDEFIIGSGPDLAAEVRIYDIDGQLMRTFAPYPKSFKGGVRVAAGDMDGDGKAEIVTAPGPGMEPRLKLFDGNGKEKAGNGVLAYQANIQGGVRVAAGDMDGDGKAEIVTAPGPGGRAHVRTFDGSLQATKADFFAFGPDMQDGTSIALLHSASGTLVAVAPESWTTSTVRLFAAGEMKSEFQPFPDASSTRLGLTLAAYDVNGDSLDELVAARNGQAAPEARILDQQGKELGRYLLLDPVYRGALSFVAVKADGSGLELAAMPVEPLVTGPLDRAKLIEVNLTQQRLYAWEHGRLAKTFLISSGVKRHPTPVMETKVYEKIPLMDYAWDYGPGNPDNYNLKDVKNNLRIRGSVLIHYAYWHHNFGHRMSHGCINVGDKDSNWIYAWSDIGTPVVIHN